MRRHVVFGVARYVGLFGLVVLLFPALAAAADLNFDPATGTFPTDTEFTVQVKLDPTGDKVNASDGKITFDPAVLSVSSISKEGSVFSLWTADPSFSNSAGTISYSGGTPSAFSSTGSILTIKFKGKKVGSGAVSISSGTVLAADGKGTNVYKNGGTATYTISAAAADVPADTPPDTGGGDGVTPIAPVITSSTHPKSENWYATTSAQFSWKPTADVTQIRTLFSDKADALAASLQSQKLAVSQNVVASKDGIWYFYVQYKNDFGWGEMAKKQIQIDTVPPKEFEISLKPEEGTSAAKLLFSTTDDLSGVDRYEVIFGSTSVATIKAAELTDSGTPVPPQDGGDTAITVKAYDKANNIRIAQKNLVLPKVAKPLPKGTEAPAAPAPFWTIERILLIVLILIVGVLATNLYNIKKRRGEEKEKLLTSVLVVREQNDRVYGAMREEFEQMVNDFDPRPQLSPEERNFLEKIKEVLDISEEVVDTSIENLKKMVREL